MSWCSRVSLCSKSQGVCRFRRRFSSLLLDLYSQESLSWSWAGGGTGSSGGAALFGGAAGLGLDKHPDWAAGAFAKHCCLSFPIENGCNLWCAGLAMSLLWAFQGTRRGTGTVG